MPDSTSRRWLVSSGLLLLMLMLVAGCQQAVYTGAAPTARSFYEDPDFHQTYIGVDLNFVLNDPSPHAPAARRAAMER